MKVFNLAEELEKERKKNKELEEKIDKSIEYINNINKRFEEIPDKELLTNRAIDISVLNEIENLLKELQQFDHTLKSLSLDNDIKYSVTICKGIGCPRFLFSNLCYLQFIQQIIHSKSTKKRKSDLTLLIGFAISGTVSLIFNLILPLWRWDLVWLGPIAVSTTIIAVYYIYFITERNFFVFVISEIIKI